MEVSRSSMWSSLSLCRLHSISNSDLWWQECLRIGSLSGSESHNDVSLWQSWVILLLLTSLESLFTSLETDKLAYCAMFVKKTLDSLYSMNEINIIKFRYQLQALCCCVNLLITPRSISRYYLYMYCVSKADWNDLEQSEWVDLQIR